MWHVYIVSIGAPKARNAKAQGNALGKVIQFESSAESAESNSMIKTIARLLATIICPSDTRAGRCVLVTTEGEALVVVFGSPFSGMRA